MAIPQRIISLDILRGFALLGILTMNITSFSMIEAAYFNPTSYGNLEGINWVVYYMQAVFADTKFMAIFSMLFGASLLMIVEKVRERGGRPFFVLSRRNLFLLVVGFAHGRFFWVGDILYAYALSAFFIFLFRNRGPRTLIIVGMVVLMIGSGLMLTAGLTAPQWPEEALLANQEDWQPDEHAVQKELSAMRGSWIEQQSVRGPIAHEMQTMIFVWYMFWRSAGMMLLGMGLYRLGVLSAQRSRRFYITLAAVGLGLGLPLAHMRVVGSVASGWDAIDAMFLETQWNYWGSLGVALGYVALVMLGCQSASGLKRLRVLAPVGQMAFTNYLMQTLICTTLFYGTGLGLFGKLQRIEQMGVVVLIWLLQILFSHWWVRRFRYGPAEYVWRLVTHLRVPAVHPPRESA